MGFCDDIPLMAARFSRLFVLSIFIFTFLLRSQDFMERQGMKTRVDVWMHGWEGERRKKENRRNTRVSFFISSLGLFFPSFLELVGCGWTEEKKEVCTVGFAFRRER